MARQIVKLLGKEYLIVYMDFKKDVEMLTDCLKKAGMEDVKSYHGGMPLKKKKDIDTAFRSKEFQVLEAIESDEVGTHNPYLQTVICISCMRNKGVLMQKIGRAGWTGEQSDGYLWFKNEQQLSFWMQNCQQEEKDKIRKLYKESLDWVYGIYNRTCL